MAYLTPEAVKEAIGDSVADVDAWDDDRIAALVSRFETLAEEYLGVAYQERGATWITAGHTGTSLVLPHPYVSEVTAVSFDGTAVTSDDLTAIGDSLIPDIGAVTRTAGWAGHAVIAYTHGLETPPQAVLDACVDFVRVKYQQQTTARRRDIDSYDDDSGYSYTVGRADPANGRPTGIPPVDDALNEVPSHRVPGIA